MTNAQAYEVFNMKLFCKALLTTALLLFVVPTTHGAEDEGSAARLISARAETAPGRSEEMYRVPGGMELTLTQACVPHSAMQVILGRDGNSVSYQGTGCTGFAPGMKLSGGDTLYCRNLSGLRRNCMMMGMLRDDPNRGGGAHFIDVDEAMAAQK